MRGPDQAEMLIYDVSGGCLGLVNSGDRARLNVTYTVTPKQVITSP